jgi:hypothetical protein
MTSSTANSSKLFIPHQIRLYDDLEQGVITLPAYATYSIILRQANWETGIWVGSAEKVRTACNLSMSLRTIQRAIQSLEQANYLRDFRKPGERGNRPVAIHRYSVRFGAHKGERLDALSTTDPSAPVFEADPCQQERDIVNDTTPSRSGHDSVTLKSGTPPKEGVKLASIPEVPDAVPEIEKRESEGEAPSRRSRTALDNGQEKAAREIEAYIADDLDTPLTTVTSRLVREALRDGYTDKQIKHAAREVVSKTPETELKPGLFLHQNLETAIRVAEKRLREAAQQQKQIQEATKREQEKVAKELAEADRIRQEEESFVDPLFDESHATV